MGDGLIKEAEDDVLDGLDGEGHAAFEDGGFVRHDDHEVVVVEEESGGWAFSRKLSSAQKLFGRLKMMAAWSASNSSRESSSGSRDDWRVW